MSFYQLRISGSRTFLRPVKSYGCGSLSTSNHSSQHACLPLPVKSWCSLSKLKQFCYGQSRTRRKVLGKSAVSISRVGLVTSKRESAESKQGQGGAVSLLNSELFQPSSVGKTPKIF